MNVWEAGKLKWGKPPTPEVDALVKAIKSKELESLFEEMTKSGIAFMKAQEAAAHELGLSLPRYGARA